MKKPHTKNYYAIHVDGVDYKGTIDDLAQRTGFTIGHVNAIIGGGSTNRYGERIGKCYPIYTFHRKRSGQYMATGTIEEVAEETGTKIKTLSNTGAYRKQFTGKYKIVEDDDMITRRTINKVAPVPVPEKYEPERKIKVVTTRPVEMREFKFKDKWINYQLSGMFRNWGEA